MNKLEDYLVSIPDFPKPGVVFRDITSILQDKDGLQLAIKEILKLLADTDFDLVAAPEYRGFLLGMPIAYQMKKGFIPVRKKGKLPRETIRAGFEMEYARTELEMHKDAVAPGQKVVIIDDLMATGNTLRAIADMVETLGGKVVKICCLLELPELEGRRQLKDYEIASVLSCDEA